MNEYVDLLEICFRKLISEYFFQLTGQLINFDSEEGIKELVSFLTLESSFNENRNILLKFVKEGKKLNLCNLIDIIKQLYLPFKQNCEEFRIKHLESILNEISLFAEYIYGLKEKTISGTLIFDDELSLRFMQNIYFFLKHFKYPKHYVNVLSEAEYKELTLVLRTLLETNMQRKHSFNFDLASLESNSNQNSISNNILNDGELNDQLTLDENQYLDMYTKNFKEKMNDYEFKILKHDIKNRYDK